MLGLMLMIAQAVTPAPVVKALPSVRGTPRAVAVARFDRARLTADARALLGQATVARASYAPTPGQPSRAELDAAIVQMKAEVDSMSAMGEAESLRLQMAMDRTAKMMETLSNLMKKISDTSQSIVQNIK